MKYKSFFQRLIIGTIVSLIVILLISYSHISFLWMPLTAIIALAIGGSLIEFYNIVRTKGIEPMSELALALSGLYLGAVTFFYHTPFFPLVPALILLVALIAPFLASFKESRGSMASIATTLLGFVYLTLPLTALYQVNFYFGEGDPQFGPNWLLYLLFVTKVSDMMGYFVGSRLGRTKLAPTISPKKSVEGSIAGLVGAAVVSFLFYYFGAVDITFSESILLGIATGVLAQLGDLSESLLKRDAQVKDSGNIPGLGGILDVADSLLFTTPFILLYLNYRWPSL